MNAFNFAVTLAVIGGLLWVRYWAARRVVAGEGRAAWFIFPVPLIGLGALVWLGLIMLPRNPWLGFGLLVVGALLLAGMLIAVRRASLGVTRASSAEDRAWKLIEPFQSFYAVTALVILLIGIIGVIVLIAFGLLTR